MECINHDTPLDELSKGWMNSDFSVLSSTQPNTSHYPIFICHVSKLCKIGWIDGWVDEQIAALLACWFGNCDP